jgi:signal transduction histidine kinase
MSPADSERPSPLAGAALAVLRGGVTATQLIRRLEEHGMTVDIDVARRALGELAQLGLARIARTNGDGASYVPTSLGLRFVDRSFVGNADQAAHLAELERLRTDLLSTIAHELRTPLTAVRTCVGLLLDPASSPDDEDRRRLLDTVGRNADRMQRVVGDILDLSRYRAGGVQLQLRRFDAASLARSAVSTVLPLIDRRGQRVEVAAPRGPVWLFGDRRRIEQALVNFVSNASKYAPEGTRIGVSVQADGSHVRLSVTDEGPGIPFEDQPRLFERFFVGGTSHAEGPSGIGLGLPIALAIAQAHGGTIDVDSVPGEGSRFTLVLPVDGPAEAMAS